MPKTVRVTSLYRFLAALEPYSNHQDDVFTLHAYPVDLPFVPSKYNWRRGDHTKEQPARTAVCYWGYVKGVGSRYGRSSRFTALFDQETGAYIVGSVSKYAPGEASTVAGHATSSHKEALSNGGTTLAAVLTEIGNNTPEARAERQAAADREDLERDELRLTRLAAQADEARKKREDLSKKVNAAVPDFIDITDPRWQLVLNAIIPVPDVI